MREHFDLPLAITNDANAAAIGEMLFGHARGMQHFLVITLGTGLGSGIVADGRLLHGASGFAGELGHILVELAGAPVRLRDGGAAWRPMSRPRGCAGPPWWCSRSATRPVPLRSLSQPELTSKRIFELAEAGDLLALEAFDRTARILGLKLADAVAHTSPEVIFLAGGLAAAGDLLLKPTQRYLNEFLFGAYRGTVQVLLSGHGCGRQRHSGGGRAHLERAGAMSGDGPSPGVPDSPHP